MPAEQIKPTIDPLGQVPQEVNDTVDEFFAEQARIENVQLRAAQRLRPIRVLGGTVALRIQQNQRIIGASEEK